MGKLAESSVHKETGCKKEQKEDKGRKEGGGERLGKCARHISQL